MKHLLLAGTIAFVLSGCGGSSGSEEPAFNPEAGGEVSAQDFSDSLNNAGGAMTLAEESHTTVTGDLSLMDEQSVTVLGTLVVQ